MLSSAALRARVASIIDALSRTAVAEIAKVVEDGMVALRLQMCQQENEISKLRSDVELLHVELSAAQRVELRADGSSAGDVQSLPVHTEHNNLSGPEFQVKAEPVDEMSEGSGGRGELVLHGGATGQWRSATQGDPQLNNAGENSLDAAGGCQPGPFGPGLLGHGPLRGLYGAARKRTVKRLMLTKGCICPTCGKCFERASHLERHKQIHTGEKPHRCDLCGRRFGQKCGLKEHMKIHSRCIEPRPVEIPALEEKPILVLNPCSEAVVGPGAEGGIANSQDGAGASVRVKTEPVEESITHRLFTKEEADALAETGSSEWTEAQYPGGSGRTGLDPVPAEASCSTSSFQGKLKNSLLSQTSYGSSDPVLISSDSGSCATAALNQSSVCETLKPKKCSACSYCGKLFHRSGHLERHLRIHTGEKPYGCHICGRCFNQNSSLKGHMRTHQRPGDTTGAPTAHPVTSTAPERPAPDAPAPAASRHQAPGSVHSEAAGEQAVMVKVEDAGGAAVTPAAQLQDQIPERDGTQEELVSGFNAMASGNHRDAGEIKRFICSHCRQSFDTFSLFEMHQCKTVTETLFTCEICDKVFNHQTTLKLHHKLHTI